MFYLISSKNLVIKLYNKRKLYKYYKYIVSKYI